MSKRVKGKPVKLAKNSKKYLLMYTKSSTSFQRILRNEREIVKVLSIAHD